MTDIIKPIIETVSFDDAGINDLKQRKNHNKHIIDFPTVYIIRSLNIQPTKVYIGETTDIVQRTLQHIYNDIRTSKKWDKLVAEEKSEMLVIGHPHFNKSLTLDIENRLIDYMMGTDSIELVNGRGNPQNLYFPAKERDTIFKYVWKKLHKYDSKLFPAESVIKDSALFKASPLKELTPAQEDARKNIMMKISLAMKKPDVGQLILVEGDAGSGKTVLLSRLFYEVMTTMSKDGFISDDESVKEKVNGCLLVNHDEQVKIYQQVMSKLNIFTNSQTTDSNSKNNTIPVSKPTSFINNTSTDNPVDVVLIDESHLLWTQGKQSYRGKNQLKDILKRAKVVIAVFDPHQILAGNEYLTDNQINQLHLEAIKNDNLIKLTDQIRVHADANTLNWLNRFIYHDEILPLPEEDSLGYDLKIFDTATKMFSAIKAKAKDEGNGISRMLATFDWPYKQTSSPDTTENGCKYWCVTTEDGFSMPWNKQLHLNKADNNIKSYVNLSQLSWAEQPQSLNEIGSTFTIQGSDLNYAGVILGPSVKYRNGKIIHDVEGSKNKNVKNKRTLDDGQKIDVSEDLLRNEVNVLLTRGVRGLFIYAVDPQLRSALLAAQSNVNNSKSNMMVAEKQENDYH